MLINMATPEVRPYILAKLQSSQRGMAGKRHLGYTPPDKHRFLPENKIFSTERATKT